MNGGREIPPSYEKWMGAAVRQATQLLARGRATQIVRLKADDYFKWLAERCAADTAAERLAYLARMHGVAGCKAPSGSLNPKWPQNPTMH